ncbi:MAG TPA: TraB/GumN family protein [Candidatus Cybelea sp.]|nr:TraB/GumN family protein [Candidatus Cybelea sp.]
MRVRAVVFALLTTAAFVVCTIRPADAAPALWLVQSSAGKVYLLGTVHMLRGGTEWRSPELEAAIKESQDLYLEIADPSDASGALASMAKIGFDREHPLSTKLSKTDFALLDEAAKRYGFGGEATFESMRPWVVYLVLSTMPALRSGYTAANGVDLQIRNEFVAAGKPVEGFETFDMQAHIFADLPERTQVALLDAQLKSINQRLTVSKIDPIVDAWSAGDETALATLLQVDKAAQSPVYTMLLTDRNKAWASTLSERLKQPGTTFVAVGAGHLLGPDGLPALLQRMGYTVTRVQIAPVPQTTPTSPVPAQSAAPAASPAPTASSTPMPENLTPPPGWVLRRVSLDSGPVKIDKMWVAPNDRGVVMSGHIDIPGMIATDLATLDTLLHQGFVAAAGARGVQPSSRVKVCAGTQDGTYTKVTLPATKEDIVLVVSDGEYIAEYARRKDVPDDPAVVRALLSLCAP